MAWANVVKKSLPASMYTSCILMHFMNLFDFLFQIDEPQLSITTSRNANDTKKPVLNGNQPTLSDYDNSFPELGNKSMMPQMKRKNYCSFGF